MSDRKKEYRAGILDGVPIGLGYLAVSFTFGIMAADAGLTVLQATILSLTNLTSAGQFAGLGVIQAGASFAEMALTELIINLRYCLMSCSLSQKLARNMPFFHRFFMAGQEKSRLRHRRIAPNRCRFCCAASVHEPAKWWIQ